MTATIELNERLVTKAKKLTGITEDGKLLNQVLKRFVEGQEFAASMLPYKDSGIWDGVDKRESAT
jgi:hypothetical protein